MSEITEQMKKTRLLNGWTMELVYWLMDEYCMTRSEAFKDWRRLDL